MSRTNAWSFVSTPTTAEQYTNPGSIKLCYDSATTEPVPASTSRTPWSTGYFAFPPGGVSARIEAPLPPKRNRSDKKVSNIDFESLTSPPQVKPTPESQALAAEGEREWVRAGGVLRDARGRVDRERTEAIKAILEAENMAAVNHALWRAYEERWRILLRDHAQGDTGELHWDDVPWPTRQATQRWKKSQDQSKLKAESQARGPGRGMYIPPLNDVKSGKANSSNGSHVTPAASQPSATISPDTEDMEAIEIISDEDIEAFIYDPVSLNLPIPPATETLEHTEEAKLLICKSKAAHHRIRRELLHWHSDKFDNAVLSRVPEDRDERERVAEDAGRVWRWLSVQGARARTTEQE